MTSPERLRQARLDRRLTQAEAAALVGVTQPAWHAWERGRRLPHRRARLAIRRHFGVELAHRCTVADRALAWLRAGHGPATARDVAQALGIRPGSALRALDQLAADGSVRSSWADRHPTSRGLHRVRLFEVAR